MRVKIKKKVKFLFLKQLKFEINHDSNLLFSSRYFQLFHVSHHSLSWKRRSRPSYPVWIALTYNLFRVRVPVHKSNLLLEPEKLDKIYSRLGGSYLVEWCIYIYTYTSLVVPLGVYRNVRLCERILSLSCPLLLE